MNRLPRVTALSAALIVLSAARLSAAPDVPEAAAFTEKYCASCHNGENRKGNLDLTALKFTPEDPDNLRRWVRIHDRVRAGEMPPKGRERPDPAERESFVGSVAAAITAHEREVTARDGRATRRRLNAYEYENVLRDLF